MNVSWRKVVIIFVVSAFHQINFVTSDCVMRGVCGTGNFGQELCSYNGPPRFLEDIEELNTLSNLCPEVRQEDYSRVCCTYEQLSTLDFKFQLSDALGLDKCPSCSQNFRTLWCKLICSPRQSDFLKEEHTSKNKYGDLIVEKLTFYITTSFAEGLFSSCKDIQGLANGLSFLDIACGDSIQEECNAERMLRFWGSTPENNGYSNIEILFEIVPNGTLAFSNAGPIQTFHPMDEAIFQCSESPFQGAPVCSCEDCEANCVKGTESYYDDTGEEISIAYMDGTPLPSTTIDSKPPGICQRSDAKQTNSLPNYIIFNAILLLYCVL